jgi:hypothetical protein
MRVSRKTVYIHIGFDRTGTTSFQRYCATHGRHLARQGVLYPTNGASFTHINHAPLTATYLPAGIPDDYHLRRSADDPAAALKAEIDASPASRVLISSEHMATRFRGPQVARLARDLEDYDCRIVATIREHFERFFSSYAIHVMSGSPQTLDDYAAMVLRPDNIYLRYAETIALWEAAFGRATIELVAYDNHDDMVARLLRQIGIERDPKARETRTLNESLDPIGTEVMRLLNVAADTEHAATSYLAFRKQEYVRTHLSHRLRQAGCSARPWQLDDDRRGSIASIAEADGRFLADAYRLELRPKAGPCCATADVTAASSHLLAKTLMHAVCEQPAQRAVIASRAIAFSVLEGMRRITAR